MSGMFSGGENHLARWEFRQRLVWLGVIVLWTLGGAIWIAGVVAIIHFVLKFW